VLAAPAGGGAHLLVVEVLVGVSSALEVAACLGR
jgi:hypothetical protein